MMLSARPGFGPKDIQGTASEMTYTVSGGALNSTQSNQGHVLEVLFFLLLGPKAPSFQIGSG